MKLMLDYTLDYLKRNRRSSIAIMVAILMTSTMMSALCGFLYTVNADSVQRVRSEFGNWHGELFRSTSASELETIRSFDSVEAVLIKGAWKTAKIDDPRRDYLVWRNANDAYWNSMPEGDTSILEGRVPVQTGEIALSKQYFEHHPELKLDDTITLPLGDRVAADGSIIAPQNVKVDGERFVQTGTVTLHVVGKMDFTTSSNVPAYTALGFLGETDILPTDELTVYLRFHAISDTYKELPKIAAAVGYTQDEYGEYGLRYNTAYLTRKNVLSPEQIGLLPLMLATQGVLAYGFIGLLVVGLFVLVIHNAFALSSASRLSQLGIFASVGATPRQIKQSVLLEALLLTVIPLPLGLLIGQLCVGGFFAYGNQFGTFGQQHWLQISISPISILPAILLTLLTVWWSALIPARKIARMSPLAAIRQGETHALKKPGRFSLAQLGGLLGLPGELAASALQARKKSYRTATVSLTFSFLTLACFLCINSASTASIAIYQTDEKQWAQQDILLTLMNVSYPDDFSTVTAQIGALPEVDTAVWYNAVTAAAWRPEDTFSTAFAEAGGFPAVEKKLLGTQLPLLRNGQRRVHTTLLGLDDNAFSAYCATLGIDPAPFYETDKWRTILYHTVDDVVHSTKRNPVLLPLYNIAKGDTLTLTEKHMDEVRGNFTFDTEITAIATELPAIGSADLGSRYTTVQVMPICQTNRLAANFTNDSSVKIEGVLQTVSPDQISPTRQTIQTICDSYFGSGDYELYDANEYATEQVAARSTIAVLFSFIAGLLAVIGLSNVWATVRGTLQARKREFAMLRSMGLSPQGVRRMLSMEAVLFGITPVFLSLPVVVALQCVFLSINEVTFLEWLPFAPWLPVLGYLAAVLATTLAAYGFGARALLRENIIEAIKTDAI